MWLFYYLDSNKENYKETWAKDIDNIKDEFKVPTEQTCRLCKTTFGAKRFKYTFWRHIKHVTCQGLDKIIEKPPTQNTEENAALNIENIEVNDLVTRFFQKTLDRETIEKKVIEPAKEMGELNRDKDFDWPAFMKSVHEFQERKGPMQPTWSLQEIHLWITA